MATTFLSDQRRDKLTALLTELIPDAALANEIASIRDDLQFVDTCMVHYSRLLTAHLRQAAEVVAVTEGQRDGSRPIHDRRARHTIDLPRGVS
jgi:hypothetical protein